MTRADFVIVGGGIVGVTLAYHLAKAGVGKVLLCERSSLGSGTTSMSGAMCGQQAEITSSISRYAVLAREIYDEFDGRVGGDCGFFRHGLLSISPDEQKARARAAAARANGAQAQAVSPTEAKEIYPELNIEDVHAAVWYPGSGCVDSYRTLHAYAAAARELGAELREQCPVQRIVCSSGRVEVVETLNGSIRPGTVILACGPWSAAVARSAGVDLPIEPSQVGVAFYRQPPEFYDRPPVLSAELSIIPWHNHHLRVLRDTRTPLVRVQPDPVDATCPQWMVNHTSDVIRHRLPRMRYGRFQGAYQTCYDDTPDLKPLLGFVPNVDNLFLDCGWSGRGFKFSVAIGEMVTNWIASGADEPDADIEPWLAHRFKIRRMEG